MIFGMNMAQCLNPQNASKSESKPEMSFDDQIKVVKKLKDLLDDEILLQDEFDAKKREKMGL